MKKQSLYKVVREASIEMVVLQRKLFDAGLLATAAKVNAASQKLGYEAAKMMEPSK